MFIHFNKKTRKSNLIGITYIIHYRNKLITFFKKTNKKYKTTLNSNIISQIIK